ncbi:MAG: DUF3887 domain-containing protein [Anaerolineales bacterium]|nr:DUF3887 domain-containing protein [Anaerolineales bacterium]MCX7609630.1 DUF3887 domain-containing protein [Anaerolineales bacterium]MDW8227225.1 DUF3887 domain-containing protein [Anaerolineales bacterium]
MRQKNLLPVSLLLFFLLLITTACGQPRPAGMSDEQVQAVTASLLNALEEKNYTAFKEYLSDEMIAALPEDQFLALSEDIRNASGRFLTTGEMRLSNRNEYAIYRMMCDYEKEKVVVTIVFKINGTKVEGLFFDSVNLRQTQK